MGKGDSSSSNEGWWLFSTILQFTFRDTTHNHCRLVISICSNLVFSMQSKRYEPWISVCYKSKLTYSYTSKNQTGLPKNCFFLPRHTDNWAVHACWNVLLFYCNVCIFLTIFIIWDFNKTILSQPWIFLTIELKWIGRNLLWMFI